MKLTAKGFTLIELIVFVVVGAIILPASLVAFSAAMQYFSTPEYYVRARFYAEQKIEDLSSLPYNSVVVSNTIVDTSTLDPGFGRQWTICHVLPSNVDVCASYDPSNESSYHYKKINVAVTMPNGESYDVSTLVTRRPKQ